MPKKPSWLGWTALILPAILLIAFVATSNKPKLHTDPPALALEIAGPGGDLSKVGDPARALTVLLKKRFPAGTDVADMRRALQAEGFVAVPDNLRCKSVEPSGQGHRLTCWTPSHPERQLVYAWGGDICHQSVVVRWDEDTLGRLKSFITEVRTGCR